MVYDSCAGADLGVNTQGRFTTSDPPITGTFIPLIRLVYVKLLEMFGRITGQTRPNALMLKT